MENKQKQSLGIFNILTILLCILLAVSIVFIVVMNGQINDLKQTADSLTDITASTSADVATLQETDSAMQEEIGTVNQSIESISTEAQADADALAALQADTAALQTETAAAIESLQTALDTYQSETNAAISAADTNLQAAQTEIAASIESLQAALDSYMAEAAAAVTDAVETTEPEAVETEESTTAEAAVEEEAATEEAAAVEEEAIEEETAVEDTYSVSYDDDTVLATVNGLDVVGSDVNESYEGIVSYYGEPDAASLELYYSVAMEEAITMKLISGTAAEMGVDQLTEEELAEVYATSDSEWQYALDNYVSYNFTQTEETTEEELAAAYAEAEDYYLQMGYTQDILRDTYLDNEIFERVQAELCKDVVVSDEDVQTYFDEIVAADELLYAGDIDAYENQVLMYQYGYADSEPWYKPEGYRYIKHILLEVDETLLTNYYELIATYEAEADAETKTVTEDDIEAAKTAILDSVKDVTDEIYAKLADGATFDELIAEYGADPGMTSGDYPNGYEVSEGSYSFITEFVTGAFSVDTIGDVTDPVISEYGIHIIQYAADVPGGPIELTDTLHETIYQTLLDEKCNEVLDAWYDSADIVYLGIIRPVDEVTADDAE